jgi:hypothetical protein
VNGEKRGGKRGRPQRAGQPFQREKQQDRRARVKQHIREMVPARPRAEELGIQQMGNGGQRSVVPALTVGERPPDPFPIQPLQNDPVLIDNFVIVVVDEPEPDGLAEDHPDNRDQRDADEGLDPRRIRRRIATGGGSRRGITRRWRGFHALHAGSSSTEPRGAQGRLTRAAASSVIPIHRLTGPLQAAASVKRGGFYC